MISSSRCRKGQKKWTSVEDTPFRGKGKVSNDKRVQIRIDHRVRTPLAHRMFYTSFPQRCLHNWCQPPVEEKDSKLRSLTIGFKKSNIHK